MSKQRISQLESLLARVQQRALEARPLPISMETIAPPSIQTMPPSPDAHAVIAQEIDVATPPPPPPQPPVVDAAESHSQLVVARPVEAPMEEMLELDDRHVVTEEVTTIDVEEDAPPPSSRRPKPLEEVPEPAIPHPAPPESGRQIAAQDLDFEDDLTGVREARKEPAPQPPEEESISLQPVNEQVQASPNPMEMDIPTHGARMPDPPPPHMPAPAASHVQVVRPVIAQAEVTEVTGTAPASFDPKTFGELLDAALSL